MDVLGRVYWRDVWRYHALERYALPPKSVSEERALSVYRLFK